MSSSPRSSAASAQRRVVDGPRLLRRRLPQVLGAMMLGAVLATTAACTAPTNQNAVVRMGQDPSGFLGTSMPDPYVMPDEALTDTSGHAFNLRTSPSRPVTLVFFGYTNCPDVCITVLSDVAVALNRMDQVDRDKVQVLFVTTDPGRDTGPKIRKYLDRFDPSFIGLTGDLQRIKDVGTDIGVPIEGTKKLPSGGYEVGHGAQVIGFDEEREGVVLWTQSTPVADLIHDFELLVAKQQ